MSDRRDARLDELLKTRRLEPASPNLADRIILKARQTPQVQPLMLGQWIKRVFAEFHLPKPAYVLAGTLIIGFVVGLNVPSDTRSNDADLVQVQSFLYSDEGIL